VSWDEVSHQIYADHELQIFSRLCFKFEHFSLFVNLRVNLVQRVPAMELDNMEFLHDILDTLILEDTVILRPLSSYLGRNLGKMSCLLSLTRWSTLITTSYPSRWKVGSARPTFPMSSTTLKSGRYAGWVWRWLSYLK